MSTRVPAVAVLATALALVLTACPDRTPPPPLPTGTVEAVVPEADGRVRLDVRYPDGDLAPVRVTPGSPCATVGVGYPTCRR